MKKKSFQKWGLLVLGISTLMFSTMCGQEREASKTTTPSTTKPLTTSRLSTSPIIATLTEGGKKMAISSIMDENGVLDAAVKQDGLDLSLALIVVPSCSVERAKVLGEKFVRLVQLFGFRGTPTGEEPPEPGVKLAKGPFTYLIGVYRRDQSQIVMGAKMAQADYVHW